MYFKTATFIDLVQWLWDNAASGIWSTFCVWAIVRLLRKAQWIAKWLTNRAPAFLRRVRLKRSNWIRNSFRHLKLRNLRWIRKHRFDTAWIGREVSRGHTSQILFLLWLGLWVLAMGLRDSFIFSDVPLARTPGAAVLVACPMYLFEIAWIRYSGRAEEIIKYRQSVKIWRFRH